jgi:hypothetical protein
MHVLLFAALFLRYNVSQNFLTKVHKSFEPQAASNKPQALQLCQGKKQCINLVVAAFTHISL